VIKPTRIRLFLDSDVLLAGILSPWGLDKAVVSLCAARICQLVLAMAVRDEVEWVILKRANQLSESQKSSVAAQYLRLIQLTRPEVIPYPPKSTVMASLHLIRHRADVPVLLSAMSARPDWVLTHNTKHFNRSVARRTGLRIATPAEFFRVLASHFVR
jgi:predicted nucleic acid-binding protein